MVAVAAVVGIGLPALQEDSATSSSSENEAIAVVLQAIEDGGQLPYAEDGQTFQNREGLLPSQPIGYYREYTVETPGSADRGAPTRDRRGGRDLLHR